MTSSKLPGPFDEHPYSGSTSGNGARPLDVSQPTVARVYDASLGGKDNFDVDRRAAEGIWKALPETRETSLTNRAMLGRGVRWLAQHGIRQFLDLGSGLPSMDNTHQVAHRIDPACRVAYVDIDPIVLAHGRAILGDSDNTTVVTADLTDPTSVLTNREVNRLIDLTQPVAVMLVGMLHHIPDEGNPAAIAAAYMDAVPAGSYLFLTHFCDCDPRAKALRDAYLTHLGSGYHRPIDQIATYFDGLELVDPGLVHLAQWHPDPDYDSTIYQAVINSDFGPKVVPPTHATPPADSELTLGEKLIVGGIARKP